MGGYDPALDELKSFCSLLEGTNKLLQDATPDLDAVGKSLVEAEPDLREALAGLEADTDGLQKDVEISEGEVLAAIARLGAAAKELLETRLPAFEGGVDGFKEHSDQATNVRAESLQAGVDTLESDGFDRFQTLLDAEKADVDRWIEQGEAALHSIAADVVHTVEALDGGLPPLTTGLTETREATDTLHDELSAKLDAMVEELEGVAVHIEKRALEAADGMVNGLAAQEESWRNEAEAAHGTIEAAVTAVRDAVEQTTAKAAGAVEAAQPVLERARLEFDQVLADVRTLAPEVGAIADLRPGIETADAEVTEIHQLMQVLDQP